jgi:hypothetical protein
VGVKRDQVPYSEILALTFKSMMGFTIIYVIIAVYSILTFIKFNKTYPRLLAAPEI